MPGQRDCEYQRRSAFPVDRAYGRCITAPGPAGQEVPHVAPANMGVSYGTV